MRRLVLITTGMIGLSSPALAQNTPPPYVIDSNGTQKPVTPVYCVGASCAGGGTVPSATNGSTAPASSISNGFTNGSGNQTAVTPSTPLPVTGTVSVLSGGTTSTATTGYANGKTFLTAVGNPLGTAGFVADSGALTNQIVGISNASPSTPTGVQAVGALGTNGSILSTAALANGASFTGTAVQYPVWATVYVCRGGSDKAGSVWVEQSDNAGAFWFNASGVATYAAPTTIAGSTVNGSATARANLTGAFGGTNSYVRCREANTDTTTQTNNSVTGSFAAQ